MQIEILGTESLGVRGLSCLVETKDRKVMIDPGVALGWSRYGFLPHPFQVAVGAEIRKRIINILTKATDVVLSHFDGDHIPLFNPNPYQLGVSEVKQVLPNLQIWAKGPELSSLRQKERRELLAASINKDLPIAEGRKDGPLEFSFPVPHGERGNEKGMLMMTRIEEGKGAFVHASDIQLLDEKTIQAIIYWKPTVVLASGPPLYLPLSSFPERQRERAWENAVNLANNVDTLIVDHHLLRSEDVIEWLRMLASTTKNRVLCAADFMKREPLLLEAWRRELYEEMPVPANWHQEYAKGKADSHSYRINGWEVLRRKGKIKPCKWYGYYSCPVVRYTEQEKLDRYWVENYCLVSNRNCVRYQMEENGKYHPDNMLPNGQIVEDLE